MSRHDFDEFLVRVDRLAILYHFGHSNQRRDVFIKQCGRFTDAPHIVLARFRHLQYRRDLFLPASRANSESLD